VEAHRVGVGVNLDDGEFGAFLVCVLVEREQSWFVRVDEVDELR